MGSMEQAERVYKRVAERSIKTFSISHFYLTRTDRDIKTSNRESLTLKSFAARMAGTQHEVPPDWRVEEEPIDWSGWWAMEAQRLACFPVGLRAQNWSFPCDLAP